MATEYTTYCCAQCGAKFAGNIGSKCPLCKPFDADAHWRSMWAQSEERMREIVREEIRAHASEAAAVAQDCAIAEKNSRVRDAALEEAATHVESARTENGLRIPNCGRVAQEIRALKSQPAAPFKLTHCLRCGSKLVDDACVCWNMPAAQAISRTEPIAHYYTVGGNTQPAAQASAEKPVGQMGYDEAPTDEKLRRMTALAECRKETAEWALKDRDTLRAQLAEANKALDEIARYVMRSGQIELGGEVIHSAPWYITDTHSVGMALARTGRLGGEVK